MAILFGHEVVAPGKPVTFDVNDPIMSWVDSKGFVARTVAKMLTKQEAKIRQKTGAPDLNTLFILNMPPRAMSKMTQGMVDSAMVDAIVKIANGHTFCGLGGVIAGFFRNQSANRRTARVVSYTHLDVYKRQVSIDTTAVLYVSLGLLAVMLVCVAISCIPMLRKSPRSLSELR